MNSSLQFKFPIDLTVNQFITQLGNEIDTHLISQRHQQKTYYDSFDWRLYATDMICESVGSKLTLKTIKNNLIIASTKLAKVPRFSQFACEKVRHTLEPILEMRALLPICTVAYQSYRFNILNEDKKTVLRVFIEEYEQLNHRVLLQTIKGYDKAAEQMMGILTQLGFTTTNKPILLAALKQQGRKVNDYSSKLAISLSPEMPADMASKIIYKQLLATIKTNEQGTIADIDSEFLHDFRVAVRRTRSALSQLKEALPDDITAHYTEFFSWLGKITSETRDFDVYLLNFDRYKNSLPVEIREHLNPLHEFLYQKQRQAQQELAKILRSSEYLSALSEWEQYLQQPANAYLSLSIKRLADKRLRKNYQRVLREGEAITEQSLSDDLHELRKSCKKLRYLMEFFQSLYEKNKMKILLKALKELQEVLGDFQDCEVQVCHLKSFSAEMHDMNTPAETFLAINILIENLNNHKCEIRRHFAEKFAEFEQEETLNTFKSLFE